MKAPIIFCVEFIFNAFRIHKEYNGEPRGCEISDVGGLVGCGASSHSSARHLPARYRRTRRWET